MNITSKSYVNVFESQRKLQRKVSFIEDGFSFLEKDVIIACIFNKTKERSKMKLKTKELTTCALFAALIAVGAFIKIDIPLPMYTMHFTLQWFFVLMAGFLLGAKLASLSVIVYLCIGLVGVPVFAAGGGPTYILRPGFGFLLGFVLAAFFNRSHHRKCLKNGPMRFNTHSSGNGRTGGILYSWSNILLLHEEFLCGNTCQLGHSNSGLLSDNCCTGLYIMRIGSSVFC